MRRKALTKISICCLALLIVCFCIGADFHTGINEVVYAETVSNSYEMYGEDLLLSVKQKAYTNRSTKAESSLRLSINYDSKEERRAKLTSYLDGTNLFQYSDYILESGYKYNIDPYFIAAVACVESARATSPMYKKQHNLFGIYRKGKPRYFESGFESIDYFCNLIASDYLEEGLDTVDLIAPKYCTKSDWAPQVKPIMNQISGNLLWR